MFPLPSRVRDSLSERARVFVQNTRIERLAAQNGLSSPWTGSLELLQTLLSIRAILGTAPDVLVDIGAHKGAFAAGADQVLGFQQIICVEPDQDLLDEVRLNVPQGKSSIHAVALSQTEGESVFFVHGDPSMNSLVEADVTVLREKFPTYRHDTIEQRQVRTTTLDVLLSEAGIAEGSSLFLKLDTQGNELNILSAAEDTLRRTDACLVEFMFCTPYTTTYSFEELVDFFRERGLTCRGALNVFRRPSHEISGVDFLFAR